MNRFKQAIGALMPNCREAIRLQSDALERALPFSQRVGLRIHLWLCVWCRRYGRQIRFLRRIAKECDHDHASAQVLPAEARTRIKRTLKTNQN
jgi:hypothetical protein